MDGAGPGDHYSPLQSRGLNPMQVPTVPHLITSIPVSLSFCKEREVQLIEREKSPLLIQHLLHKHCVLGTWLTETSKIQSLPSRNSEPLRGPRPSAVSGHNAGR